MAEVNRASAPRIVCRGPSVHAYLSASANAAERFLRHIGEEKMQVVLRQSPDFRIASGIANDENWLKVGSQVMVGADFSRHSYPGPPDEIFAKIEAPFFVMIDQGQAVVITFPLPCGISFE